MKTLNHIEIFRVYGGSLYETFAGISAEEIYDIEGVPHVDYGVAYGVMGPAPCMMVPLSQVDYSLSATVGRLINKFNPF